MLKPFADRVIVIRDEGKKEVGGLIIPESAQDRPNTGTVTAVGEGRVTETGELIPNLVKIGDKVMFGKHDGIAVSLDREYLILRDSQIYGVLNG